MRNVAAHAYFAVNLQVVSRTVQEELPKLKQQIDQLLSQPWPSPEPEPAPCESTCPRGWRERQPGRRRPTPT